MALKRPRLKRREEVQQASAPAPAAPAAGSGSSASTGSGISTAALQAALGGSYAAPSGGSAGGGITNKALGQALTSGGGSGGNRSVYSTRHTSYPLQGDLSGIQAKAGTRLGPRTTSYRIPLQKTVQQNVYDTVN